MLQRRFLVAIIGLLAAVLALEPNLVKSQAQPQIPALLSPTERLDEWAKNSPNEPILAGIFFDKRIPDAQLVQLMRRYNVQPKAVYMSVAGMSGTHRPYENQDAETVIAEARRITTEMMLNSRKSTQIRAKNFVERHPKSEFLAESSEATPQIDAKSLLENIEQNEAALAWSRGNKPLIYGAEVIGSIEDIKKLAADPVVKGFEPAIKFNGRVIVPPSNMPAQIQSSQDMAERTQSVRALNKAGVRARIEDIAGGNGLNKGGNQ